MQDERKNNLENFVKENRLAFDDAMPSKDVWSEIDKRILMSSKSTYRKEVWLWRAASIVLLMVSTFLAYNRTETIEPVAQITKEDHQEFNQVENFYVAQISEKRIQIDAFLEKDDVEVDEAYEVDLARLDAMYEVLKEELKKSPDSKEIKDALTLNLLVRINVLNNQLQEIEELEEEEVEQAT